MTNTTLVEGKLVALHWSNDTSGQTMEVDTSQLSEAVAELEDAHGLVQRMDVLAGWDADYLVGKNVKIHTTDQGKVLTEST